ncbi:MAG TPA: 50S ribosomal protein L18e [Candidatus Nanoarchaeia archaeon]|nr:50S ribosomal protein L18e [Candidatus Nanoarchaeia archaeon]
MRTGPTNINLSNLIGELRKKAYADNIPLFERIAEDLEKSTRQRREVNLSKISRYAKKGELVVVPGKVLATGELNQSVTIAAWKFSVQALDKISKANAKAITFNDLMKNGVKGTQVRIIG